MGWVRAAVATLALAILCAYSLIRIAAVEHKLDCSGSLRFAAEADTDRVAARVRIAFYQPWLAFVIGTDGAVWFEIPNRTIEYYDHLEALGDHDYRVGKHSRTLFQGHYAHREQTLTLNTQAGMFEGTCR